MPLGTLDRTPPPFFRQGPSALTKLAVCTAAALFLMVADTRFEFAVPLRAGLATALAPVQRALLVPVELIGGGGDYLRGLQQAQTAEARALEAQAAMAERAARADALAAENAQLRTLLALGQRLEPRHQAAEVLYEARDAYSRKLVIGSGQAQGVRAGSPVIDPDGVLGQVTRVYPLSAEVTLLSDRQAAIPVLNRRTRQRAAAFGGMSGADGATMELRFVSANADIQVGDLLETGGLDGVYPPALPVATVVAVERRVEGGFARVLLRPVASGDAVRHVLVLEPAAARGPVAAAATAASVPGAAASGAAR